MILVDSSVWVSYFNGVADSKTDKLHDLLGTEPVGIGDLILTEVLQGFRNDEHFNKAKLLFDQLFYFSLSNKLLALSAAENYRYLRKRGVTVRKTINTVIATFCIEEKIPLLHDDADFNPFFQYLGLRVVG